MWGRVELRAALEDALVSALSRAAAVDAPRQCLPPPPRSVTTPTVAESTPPTASPIVHGRRPAERGILLGHGDPFDLAVRQSARTVPDYP